LHFSNPLVPLTTDTQVTLIETDFSAAIAMGSHLQFLALEAGTLRHDKERLELTILLAAASAKTP
jgi:hypothetical protein